MTTNFPPDQTVVLKGLRRNITQPEVQRFVKDATPYVQSIHMSQDKYPPRDTHPVLAYLNYQSSSQARQAKVALDQAIKVAKAKGNPIDPSVLVTYLKEAGAKSLFPPAFSVWVGNLKDSDDYEIEKKISKFGPLVTFASHGLPPFKIFETIPGNKSAIFNFINFKDAKTALDACILRLLIFGKTDRAYATGQPQTHTKLVLDVLERCRSQNHLTLSFIEVDLVASQQGNHKPERWIDALRLCPQIFDIEDRQSIISIRGGINALESLLPASLPTASAQDAWAAAAGSGLSGANVWGAEGLPSMDGFGDSDGLGVAASVAHLVLRTDLTDDGSGGSASGGGGSNGVGSGQSAGLLPPHPTAPAASRPRPPPAGRPQDWSVQEVCDLLEGTCGYNVAGVRANSIDGKTLMDLFSDEEGRNLMLLPVEEGGLGLSRLQLRRVLAEIRAVGGAAGANGNGGGGGGLPGSGGSGFF